MKISAIQSQLANSSRGVQANESQYYMSATKDLTTDRFSKEKTNKVDFKGLLKNTLAQKAIGVFAILTLPFIIVKAKIKAIIISD